MFSEKQSPISAWAADEKIAAYSSISEAHMDS